MRFEITSYQADYLKYMLYERAKLKSLIDIDKMMILQLMQKLVDYVYTTEADREIKFKLIEDLDRFAKKWGVTRLKLRD